MNKTFFFERQNKDEWLENSSKLNKEIFNILNQNKYKNKNYVVMVRELEDCELKELLGYYNNVRNN